MLEREQVRLTVRIPATLYDRLEAFAETAHFTRGTPQLSGCVRDALEHFLVCPHKRQTQTVHTAPGAHNGQTQTVHTPTVDNNGQTKTVQTSTLYDNGQTERSTEAVVPLLAGAEDTIRQIENGTALVVSPARDTGEDTQQTGTVPAAVPPYDHTRYQLGVLCKRGHDWQGTGHSLRELRGGKVGECAECHRARARATNARRLAKQNAGQ